MTTQNLADSVSAAMIESLTAACSLNPRHRIVRGDGARILITGTPVAALNPLLTSTLTPDPAEIDRLAAQAGEGLPFRLALRREPSPEILEVAARYGLGQRYTWPLMVCHNNDARLRGTGVDAPAIRAMASDEWMGWAKTAGAAFGAKPAVFHPFNFKEVIDGGWRTIYIAEVGGVPVGVAAGARFGEYVGIFSVGVLPRFRGLGYGRVLTERVMTDAFHTGATVAYLQPSDLGLRLYQTLGFRTSETWTYLSSGKSSKPWLAASQQWANRRPHPTQSW